MEEGRQQLRRLRPTRRKLVGFALIFLLAGWAASTFAVTWALTHRRDRQHPETPFPVEGVARTDLTLTTSDGETLGAWLFPGRDDRPVAIVMHGNNGSRTRSRTTVELLAKKGCTVLALTLRAHGDSTGSINDIGWSARKDLVAAVDFVQQKCPGRDIIVCGRSMSSAAAIFAAKDLGNRIAGYWLEQPYNSLETAAWRRLQAQLPPVFDAAAFAGMRMWSLTILPASLGEIAPASCICDVPEGCPLVILSGDADLNLPLDDVKEVFAQVKDRAKLVVFPGAGHIAMPESDPALYERELDTFLADVQQKKAARTPSDFQ